MSYDDTAVALMVKSGEEGLELGAATYTTAPKHSPVTKGTQESTRQVLWGMEQMRLTVCYGRGNMTVLL